MGRSKAVKPAIKKSKKNKNRCTHDVHGIDCFICYPSIPNPGSDSAISLGCSCPVLDNCHGLGYMRQAGVFVTNGDCIVHDDVLSYEVRLEYNRQNEGE